MGKLPPIPTGPSQSLPISLGRPRCQKHKLKISIRSQRACVGCACVGLVGYPPVAIVTSVPQFLLPVFPDCHRYRNSEPRGPCLLN